MARYAIQHFASTAMLFVVALLAVTSTARRRWHAASFAHHDRADREAADVLSSNAFRITHA